MNYDRNENVEPSEALRELKRLAARHAVHVAVSAELFMPSSEGRGYPYPAHFEVTQKVMKKLLDDLQRFHDAKKERGEVVPTIPLRTYSSDYNANQKFFTIG